MRLLILSSIMFSGLVACSPSAGEDPSLTAQIEASRARQADADAAVEREKQEVIAKRGTGCQEIKFSELEGRISTLTAPDGNTDITLYKAGGSCSRSGQGFSCRLKPGAQASFTTNKFGGHAFEVTSEKGVTATVKPDATFHCKE